MTGTEIEKQAQVALAYLHTLRDEIRVQIHLGGLDLKQAWSELEPLLTQVERQVKQATTEVLAALHGLTFQLENLRTKLHAKDAGAAPPT